ncbi:unnamed protein product [Kuraishia capsulata CBS 1993]|uniref:Protein RTA1 n=1 Tax=Kuraishia capsulata CBS 1993 TaxID=1382522 RepID=W6MUY3_9ASCO|nr:uncharacterized protein KUCA_T00001956001 [Kuraishia capsulata CBS 1993]CDK25985.1 unnamed protein product [Kuraishia capsulata CBS 1993]
MKNKSWREFYYSPTTSATIAFAVLFGVCLGVQTLRIVQIWRSQFPSRMPRRSASLMMVPFAIGTACEMAGYIGRCFAIKNQTHLGAYIEQMLMLIIAPPFLAASIYMIFGRLVVQLGANELCPVPRKYLTTIFVSGDIASIVVQGIGGGMMSGTDLDRVRVGQKVVVVGLFIQIVFFLLFVYAETRLFFRLRSTPTNVAFKTRHYPGRFHNWHATLISMFAVSMLILVRSVYRVVEFIQGFSGYISSHEWYLFVFDSSLMFLVVITMMYQDVAIVLLRTAEPAEVSEPGEEYKRSEVIGETFEVL